jgi:hypothetical protein
VVFGWTVYTSFGRLPTGPEHQVVSREKTQTSNNKNIKTISNHYWHFYLLSREEKTGTCVYIREPHQRYIVRFFVCLCGLLYLLSSFGFSFLLPLGSNGAKLE